MTSLRAQLNHWRYQLGLAWLEKSASLELLPLKDRCMRQAIQWGSWVLPALEWITCFAAAGAAVAWGQATFKTNAEAWVLAPIVFFISVMLWEMMDLLASQSRITSSRKALGCWLARPFMLYENSHKEDRIRQLVSFDQPMGLFAVEFWFLLLLFKGLTNASIRQDSLEVKLPEAAKEATPKSRF